MATARLASSRGQAARSIGGDNFNTRCNGRFCGERVASSPADRSAELRASRP
jgi:hypothetical protein